MSNNEEEQEENPDKFLTDEEEATNEEEYVKPDIELKLPYFKRKESKEVVAEINKQCSPGQRQLLYLIYLLSLQLEDRNTMNVIINACKTNRKELNDDQQMKHLKDQEEKEQEEQSESNIIIPR